MKTEFLRNFIKLVEYKSFSRLAENLPISQSTLSHQINQLEKELGDITLIDRTTRTFELTKAGKIFLEYGKKILKFYDDCLAEINEFKEIEEISISASTLPGSHILPKFLANFRSDFPNISFKIQINNSKKSIDLLKKGMVDFAGIGSFMNNDKKEFDSIIIGKEQLVFVCNPEHELLRNNDLIKIKDLAKFSFIAREEGSGTRNIMAQRFKDFDKLSIDLVLNDNDSIISAVSDSNFVSILSELIAKRAEDAGLLKILKIEGYPTIANREIYFIKLKNTDLTPLKKKYWNYVKQNT